MFVLWECRLASSSNRQSSMVVSEAWAVHCAIARRTVRPCCAHERIPVQVSTCLRRASSQMCCTANLCTKILDFRGFDSRIINLKCKGWNSHVHRGFPGKLESTNLSRDS